MKRVLGIAGIAFLLYFVLTQPGSAADVVRGAGGVVENLFNALITFATQLVG